MDNTKRLFCNISSNYEGLNDPLDNYKGLRKIGKYSLNQLVREPGVQWRSKGDKNFLKDGLSSRGIVRRNTLSGAVFMRDVESTKSVDSEVTNQRQRSKTDASLCVKSLSLSLGITGWPEFGRGMAGYTNIGSSTRKIEWPLKGVGSATRHGVLSKMSDGRLMHVLLLDEQKLEIVVQPKLYAFELHGMAASHLRLKEKDFFGLSFRDETGHYQWLQPEQRVLEHDFPRRSGPLVLYFQVRLYIESITYLKCSTTVRLFYLQAIQSLYKGQIECDSETVFELAAYVIQAAHGDYIDDETSRMQMKRLMLLSTSVLKQHPSLTYCEDQVIEFYKTLKGHTLGSATVNYMSIVESLPTYGIHYYEVKDKTGIPWWLGISFRGISVYDHADRKIPRKVFAWKQLENLYFREKKFSIEVVDLKMNTSGSVTVNVHSWMASTTHLAKCIWTMTVSQHQFYLNRKHRKSVSVPVRSLSDIADDINETLAGLEENSETMTGSEVDPDVVSSSSSSPSSFTCSKLDLMKAKELEAMKAARQEEYVKLKVRKEELQQELVAKMNKLRELCLKEADLTGVIPPELPLKSGELPPHVRKRIGTTFVLSPKCLSDGNFCEEDKMKKLEMGFEILEKIMEAELQLAQDKSLPKSVRKKHRRTYRQEYQKLKVLEGKINALREQAGKERVVVTANSLDDTELDTPTPVSPTQMPTFAEPENQPPKLIHNYYRRYTHHELSHMLRYPSCTTPKEQKDAPRFCSPESSFVWSKSLGDDSPSPCSTIRYYPKKAMQASPSPRSSPCRVNTPPTTPAASRVHGGDGCSVSSAQSSESQFQSPPFFPARKQSGSSLGSDFTNSCSSSMSSLRQISLNEREENLYNINTYLTGCYESGDELLNPATVVVSQDEKNSQLWPTKHGSLDRRYNAQSRFNENSLSGSLDLPELVSSVQFGNKRGDRAVDHCTTPTPCEGNLLPGGHSLRKNCSERSHHHRRDKLTEQAKCIGSRGQSASNVYQFHGDFERTFPASPSGGKQLRQQAAPGLYVPSPMGEMTQGAQRPFEALSVRHADTMHTPQQVLSFDGGSPISASGSESRELGPIENQMESSFNEALDSPEKLARFRKERYGRCAAVSSKVVLPSGHNKDAVDALFRHHEETPSPAYTYPGLHAISSQSSSALCQSDELSRASTPTPENSVI